MAIFTNNKVVVPVDFSKHSLAAVEQALKVVETPSQIHAVHVLPIITPYDEGMAWAEVDSDARRKHAAKSLNQLLSNARFNGVKQVVLLGDPGTEIADYAQQQQADLVVMPSHGYTGLKRLLLGSVAERVVRLSPCAVLILKHLPVSD